MTDIFAKTADKMARIKERVRALAREKLAAYQFKRHPTGIVIIHESTRNPGTWQISHFDANGEPTGHTEAPSRMEALTAAAKWYGADLGDGPMRMPRRRK